MDWRQTCGVVIPCFNEALTITGLVAEVRRYLPTVVVVDDGSSDDTARRAQSAGARVVQHRQNRGKGAALRTGFEAACGLGLEWALTMDGDGQHRPEDIPALLNCAAATGAKLVVGDRMHDARAIPWLRRWVNRWMSRQLSRAAGCRLPDTQCGFRLLELACWRSVRLQTQHFEVESELLLAFVRAGHRIEFAPIQVVGRSARSRIRPVADAWRWLRWWRTARKG